MAWAGTPSAPPTFPTPYLGRTVRIVGPVENVDLNQTQDAKTISGRSIKV